MDSEICTNCSSYQLCMPQCEAPDGEWGACGLWKEIVQWDNTCDKWWVSNPDAKRENCNGKSD